MTRSWLLLPGLGDGGLTLAPLAEGLGARGEQVAIVGPHREPPWLEGGLLEGLAAGLQARLGASAIVVGHSAGGLVGLLLAERPGLLGLASIEGSLRPTDEAVVAGFLDGSEPDSGRQRLLLALADRTAEHERLYRDSVRETAPALFSRLAREIVARRREMVGRWQRLRLPRLFIAAAGSAAGQRREEEALAGPGAEVARVEGVHHWPHFDQPATVAGLLIAWADRHRLGRP